MKGILNFGFVLGYFLITVQLSDSSLFAQNELTITDFIYDPDIISPVYPENKGPKIYLDEGHHIRNTYGGLGGFKAFRNVLRNDGYQVVSIKDQFTSKSLQIVRIIVIALAQNEKNLEPRWYNPTYSAFKGSELIALKKWVKNGGSLFLIVDHHPFAGAAKDLAKEFGIELINGHAMDKITANPHYFNINNKTLHSNIITKGRNHSEIIDSILTFSGSAMNLPVDAKPILTFDKDWLHYLPERAWDFENIKPTSIEGLSQGAFMEYGIGKLVIFGDGNMFSAQVDKDGEVAGFIHPYAKHNYRLLLNIIHYLDGLLE